MIHLITNVLPICENPRTRKGRLMTKSRTDSEMPEICRTNSEIPVTPPSINIYLCLPAIVRHLNLYLSC